MGLKATLTFLGVAIAVSAGLAFAQIELAGTFGGATPTHIHVQGGLAYCSAASGFLIVDVTDPAAPTRVGFLPMPDTYKVFVDGDRAYTTSPRHSHLVVLDVSDPTSPSQLGSAHAYQMLTIHVVGDIAYLGCADGKFLIFDVSDPSNMHEISRLDHWDRELRVFVQGTYAYVTPEARELSIVDVSDPASPSVVGVFETCPARDVFVVGNLAYVAAMDSGMVVLDVADPSTPERIGRCRISRQFRTIKVSGTNAYVWSPATIAILDVSDPYNPTVAASFDLASKGLDASGDSLYILHSDATIEVLDASVPSDPVPIGRYLAFGHAGAVHADTGGPAYLLDAYQGLAVLDVSDPASPAMIGHGDVINDGVDMCVSGSRAYLVGGSKLEVVDVADDSQPVSLGWVYVAESLNCVDVLGEYAYVGTYWNGMRVVDTSNPASMVEIASVETLGRPWDIRIVGERAYIADGKGLAVFDLSDPTSPTPISSCDLSAWHGDELVLDVQGQYAYVAEDFGWFYIVDISRPDNPTEVGRLRISSRPTGLIAFGRFVAISHERMGLSVVDVTDPESPHIATRYEVAGKPAGVSVVDGYIYLATNYSVLHALAFTPPEFAVSGIVTRDEGSPAHGVEMRLSGCVADMTTTDDVGFYEFRGVQSGTYTVTPTSPGWSFTPKIQVVTVKDHDVEGVSFSGAVSAFVRIRAGSGGYASRGGTVYIELVASRTGDVRVDVYTMEGERVWETSAEVLAGTGKVVPWDCVNSAGQPVASGVYLIRVTGAGLDELKKAVVVN